MIVCGMTRVGVVGGVVANPAFLHALHTSLHRQYILLHLLVITTQISSIFYRNTDNLSVITRVNGFFCLLINCLLHFVVVFLFK